MHWVHVSLAVLAALLAGAEPINRYRQQAEQQTSIYYTEPTMLMNTSGRTTDYSGNGVTLTELHGGRIVRGQRLLQRSKSPYLLREDLYVESDGELVLEPGVEVRFGPMVGITVRGVVTAKVIIRQNCIGKVETSTKWTARSPRESVTSVANGSPRSGSENKGDRPVGTLNP